MPTAEEEGKFADESLCVNDRLSRDPGSCPTSFLPE